MSNKNIVKKKDVKIYDPNETTTSSDDYSENEK